MNSGLRVKFQNPSVILVVCRKKHFIPLHRKEKKVYIFPNTSGCLSDLPHEYDVCDSISSFKVKSLRGGFQRRPELIAQCGRDDLKWDSKSEFTKRRSDHIQLELTEMALYLVGLFQSSLGHQSNRTVERETSESKSSKSGGQTRDLKFALDIGCGTGVSMIPLITDSYVSIGTDLNIQSLTFFKETGQFNNNQSLSLTQYNASTRASSSSSSEMSPSSDILDLVQWDLRHGLPFQDETFDLCLSISFLQWLFYGERHQQLDRFFSSLYRVVRPGGKSVIQFYPRSPKQLSDAVKYARQYFNGALVGEYPHVDRGRKLFLLLYKNE